MSEDRLEKALEAMRNEGVAAEESTAARARVWEKLAVAAPAACAEFSPRLKDYLEGRLAENRRMLLEDHLSRCAECRRELAALRGETKVVPMPQRRVIAWPRFAAWALAAGLALIALYVGRQRIDQLLAPAGPRMTVAVASGDVYRLPEGALSAGSVLADGETLRTGARSRAVVRLADGSAVEVNEQTELFVRAAWSGQAIHLQRGDLIVQAATQRRGRLRVETRDSVASVKGTVFAVSAGVTGSVVSVLEGTVEVAQPGGERLLKAGEQAASNPALRNVSVREAVAWSKDAEKYLALVRDFAKLERQMAAVPAPALRTEARLLRYLPPNAVVFAAVPNLTGTVGHLMALAEQQAAQSAVFREWWNSEAGKEPRRLLECVQTVTPLLGEEIGFVLARGAPGEKEPIALLLAEVQAGKAADLRKALDAIATGAGTGPFAQPGSAARRPQALPYYVTEGLMVLSNSRENVQRALGSMGRGASGDFSSAIAQRYQRGAGWLLAIDVASLNLLGRGGPALEPTGAGRLKHILLEQRTVQGVEENEATVTFQGARTGLASWLAPAGSSGAAEYIPSDAVFAFSAAIREPRELFDELTGQLAQLEPNFPAKLSELEAKLGINLANDVAAALGTDFAVAIERPAVPVPVWLAAAAVYKPESLDATVRRLADLFNGELKPEDQNKRIALVQETVDGRTWNTLRTAALPLVSLTWTYDRGYLVAGPDKAAVTNAIATRSGGFPLVWAPAFQQQLPPSAGMHPSGFVWLNTKGALEGLANLIPSPALRTVLAERDPLLVVLNGEREQIRAASRTGLTSLLVNMMMAGAPAGGRGERMDHKGTKSQRHKGKSSL
jgi:hypothetical protein